MKRVINLLIILGFSFNIFCGDYHDASSECDEPIQKKPKRLFNCGDEEKQIQPFNVSKNQPFVLNKTIAKKKHREKNNIKQRRGSFKISPKKKQPEGIGSKIRQDAVYIFTADKKSLPSHAERIDFQKIYAEEIEDENERLDLALLAIEKAFVQWTVNHPKLVANTFYVGLAHNATERYEQHYADCSGIKDGQNIKFCESSKKLEWMSYVWNKGRDVQMSILVYRIVPDHMPVVEVLLAKLFKVLEKGSEIAGNHAAYDRVNAFRQSEIYKNWMQQNNTEQENLKSLKDRNVFHSPVKKTGREQNAVYMHFFVEKNKKPTFIPDQDERINFGELYRKHNKNLEEVLRDIEVKFRMWIKNDQRFYDNVCYVGEAQQTINRLDQHIEDLLDIMNDENLDSLVFEAQRKQSYLKEMWPERENEDIQQSAMVWNIKNKEHRLRVEVLVGELMNARAKGSSRFGKKDSYKYLDKKYWESKSRKNLLESLDLNNICEDLRAKQHDGIFNPADNQ